MLARALVLSLLVVGCGGEAGVDPGGGAPPDASTLSDAGTPIVDAAEPGPDAGGLVPGSLQVSWMHGSSSCAQNNDPELQVHAYNDSTYILRQNKCRTFEAPFVYLLLGQQSALLLDTGATYSATLRYTVQPMV